MRLALLVLVCLVLLAISLPFQHASASKGNLAVRADLGAFEDVDYDRPFRTTAIIEGRCRDVEVPLADSRKIKWLYKIDKEAVEKIKPEKVGILYFNDLGQEAVCFEDLAVTPFVVKNVVGDMVTISGWVTSGKDYGLEHEEIIICESMELLEFQD